MSKEVIVVSCRSSDVFWTLFILIHFLPRVSVRQAKTSAKLRTRVKIGKQLKEIILVILIFYQNTWSILHIMTHILIYQPLIGHMT